jgi:hypothetical protein
VREHKIQAGYDLNITVQTPDDVRVTKIDYQANGKNIFVSMDSEAYESDEVNPT